MKFFTEIEVPESPLKIDYSTGIMMMGSCFAENIGGKLQQLKFDIDLNPFGILYNPVSIANSLEFLVGKRLFSPSDLFFSNGTWSSVFHHGRFSDSDPGKALDEINSRIIAGSENLKKAKFLFLTFGTAWVYEYIKTGQVVSNCHKIPAGQFNRYRLDVSDITETYLKLLGKIKIVNPGLNIVFTVSPIRHWKDGAVGNQVSKSTLILAISKIIERLKDPRYSYFPSYEIVMDELRDYRFYAEDMLHISDTAINFIWNRFVKTFIEPQAKNISDEVAKIIDATNHRPFNSETGEYAKFIKKCLDNVKKLLTMYPFLDLSKEMDYFKEQIGE
jgi:hypothetical protein